MFICLSCLRYKHILNHAHDFVKFCDKIILKNPTGKRGKSQAIFLSQKKPTSNI
jgi:hypothetical protein